MSTNTMQAKVRTAVFESLRELMEQAGVDATIDDDLTPIFKGGLDSVYGLTLALMLEEKLEISIPDEMNPLVDDTGPRRRPRTVVEVIEIVETIARL